VKSERYSKPLGPLRNINPLAQGKYTSFRTEPSKYGMRALKIAHDRSCALLYHPHLDILVPSSQSTATSASHPGSWSLSS